ncbi:RNA-directed DNA polymerase, eukaryota, Reverse transcriptase zinc-binding domain protein [Artemisia annua]|uniref:RNA-directed DNA polymerase, eukaryota, Reverse transcriptase zinc-binding domain protein n=1 Tax=Artemisia annua TaxID=35608 RepID=A0A2U1M5Y7_ARTAN|nr:RNA-directed DNA polymerase, eukaryota, Reverse transcriptase zinc-binding domain protein [Artemisia annua]
MSNVSWGWKKVLQIRDIVRPFFWDSIGNGHKTSFWFDNWSEFSPLKSHFSVRSITREGFDLRESVVDIVNSGSWNFPNTWLDLFPVLNLLDIPIFSNREDQVLWRKSYCRIISFRMT